MVRYMLGTASLGLGWHGMKTDEAKVDSGRGAE